MSRTSVAMTGSVAAQLRDHLLRRDGQEDICLATYRPSTGAERTTAVINNVILPEHGERAVHGNASLTSDYVLRATSLATRNQSGVVLLHSHPGGRGWQRMSGLDVDAERSYAHVVHEVTGLPLFGMTLAGIDHGWSARWWSSYGLATWSESVRVIDDHLAVTWNDDFRQPPDIQPTQLRTVSGWGEQVQSDIARLRVLVIGAGSVGLEVALRLAASGISHIGVMDFDTVEIVNLDRMIGATALDVALHRAKVKVAERLLADSATAYNPRIDVYELSVCENAGHAVALDYDVIFSCVDRPWPRAVLNVIAYADLIPVIDGGIHIDPFPDHGMRNATWRSHVVRPGRPCLACSKQLDLGMVCPDREGLLDDPDYIARAGGTTTGSTRQNVSMLSVSVVATLLAQFVSFVVAPGGLGEPGPLRYCLSTHSVERLRYSTRPNCIFEGTTAAADGRLKLTGSHTRAEEIRAARAAAGRRPSVRLGRRVDNVLAYLRYALGSGLKHHA